MADVQLILTIPGISVPRILDAFDATYPGRTTANEEGQPFERYTKREWTILQVKRFIKEVLKGYEAGIATEQARLLALESAEAVEIT